MKKITIFQSDDGMTWDTYEECLTHERNVLRGKLENGVKFYDYNKKEVDVYTNNLLAVSYYIKITDGERASEIMETINTLCDFTGDADFFSQREIKQAGESIWLYLDEENDGWYNADDLIKKLNQLKEELQ